MDIRAAARSSRQTAYIQTRTGREQEGKKRMGPQPLRPGMKS